ncbi:MAG: ExbD/TolR family protein [Desulfomonilia bacterium]|jgi:biopolymer transport protein ExbD|uniref:Biopolymer transport protein ExbD n=1 Tax=anaerobic digester metagenome TaxID=1263854 RepID=A0A485M560_9ZZZZ|nr:biopolymer transporter ExbD [Pseudomonadota bacterium]HON37474.1 biopolymer transporter ExbD [Deltaproteobacteria bacterium]HRS55580.1 biopolymer transporter ExbD [Desulfomonilia bacterium]HPD20650.1 biopolymer transporter ExbD [Deltaproteobacteria bacterium]HPX17589.1 biopolymer transporter ExbD [Deltaproteobacteria bacterium]
MKFRRKRDKNISAIDITPLVDVVFLLLIFFMLSLGSPLKLSEVSIPESKSGDSMTREAITVALSDRGLFIDGAVSGEEMLELLPTDTDIVILADKNIPYFRVMAVLDTLRSSGHERISLATRPLKN